MQRQGGQRHIVLVLRLRWAMVSVVTFRCEETKLKETISWILFNYKGHRSLTGNHSTLITLSTNFLESVLMRANEAMLVIIRSSFLKIVRFQIHNVIPSSSFSYFAAGTTAARYEITSNMILYLKRQYLYFGGLTIGCWFMVHARHIIPSVLFRMACVSHCFYSFIESLYYLCE